MEEIFLGYLGLWSICWQEENRWIIGYSGALRTEYVVFKPLFCILELEFTGHIIIILYTGDEEKQEFALKILFYLFYPKKTENFTFVYEEYSVSFLTWCFVLYLMLHQR